MIKLKFTVDFELTVPEQYEEEALKTTEQSVVEYFVDGINEDSQFEDYSASIGKVGKWEVIE